jgi:very-short-patch-repair endonuclease
MADLLERRGGFASRASLIRATSRREVDEALRSGAIVRVGHGRYALPSVDDAVARAAGMNGVLCLTSAAQHHGWEVRAAPVEPHILVPRNRRVPPGRRQGIVLHRGTLGPDDISDGIATSRELTLVQCMRGLPHADALSVVDSALRHGEEATLRRVVATVRGAGRQKVLTLAGQARAGAANPFESSTRSIALTVSGLDVEPQVVISSNRVWARPDLVDVEQRIIIECDSFEWHGDRKAFRRDCRRYTLLVADGWSVVRFTWEDVMFEPEWVRQVLVDLVRHVDTQTEVDRPARRAA